MSDEIFVPEKRVKFLRKIHRIEGIDACVVNAKNDGEVFVCKTFEINRISDKIERQTWAKQGYIYDDIKELEKILKSMPIIK